MDDEQVERRLRQVRPVGPPASLRTRVLESSRPSRPRPIWMWLPAAAAILAIAFVGWRTERVYSAVVPPHPASAVVEREVVIDELGRAWGGSDASRAAAAAALATIDDASRPRSYVVSPEGSIK